jgi:hypothetical protein
MKNDDLKTNSVIAFVMESINKSPIALNHKVTSGTLLLQHTEFGILTVTFNRNANNSVSNPGLLYYRVYSGKGFFKKFIGSI